VQRSYCLLLLSRLLTMQQGSKAGLHWGACLCRLLLCKLLPQPRAAAQQHGAAVTDLA
jgi:hypothetical protein